MADIERSWMIYEAHPVSEGELIEVVPAAEVERLREALRETEEARDRWRAEAERYVL